MVQMADVKLSVRRSCGGWQVLRDGREAGQFDFRVDAVEGALRQARTELRRGRSVVVDAENAPGRIAKVAVEPPAN